MTRPEVGSPSDPVQRRLGRRILSQIRPFSGLIIAFVSAGLALPSVSRADVGTVYGANSAAVARAGQLVASATGDAASLHNVAALASTESSVRIGYTGAMHAMGITRRCSSGGGCLRANTPVASRSLAGGWSGQVHDRVGLGVTFSTPMTQLVRVTAPDPRRPQFPALTGLADRFALFAGIGVRVLPWLDVGVGAQVHAQLASAVVLKLDPIHKRLDRADVEIHLGPDVGATAGIRLLGPAHSTFAATWHQAASVPYAIPAQIGVDGVASVRLQLNQLAHSTPHAFDLAAAWNGVNVQVEAGLRWQRWSLVQGLGPDLTSDVAGDLIDGIGLGGVADIDAPAVAWSPRLHDTVSAAVSGRWRLRDALTLRGGWRYRPSPFPNATPEAALLDSAAHIFAGGVALRVQDWTLGAGAQLWLWQTRRPATGSVAGHSGTTVVSSFDLTRHF